MKKWKLISSKLAFDNPWFRVRQDEVELSNGKIIDDFFVWLQGQIVMVVPVTKDHEFILVKQYKHGHGDFVIEFPAGWANEKEDLIEAAKRELREETGYSSNKITHLKTLTELPTKVVGNLNIYLAENVKKSFETEFDDNEDIEVLVKPYKEVMEMILNGEIIVTGTIAAAFLACQKLNLEI